MKTIDLYHPLDKHYPFLKDTGQGVDKINRAVLCADQIDLTCHFWTAFFADYGWAKLDQAVNDLHFHYYGAEPDGMDPAVTRKDILAQLSLKAGVALAQGHCVDELFGDDSLRLYANGTLDGKGLLWIYRLTLDAAQVFHLPYQEIDYAKDLPGLLYLICGTRTKSASGDLFLDACVQAFDETLKYLDKLVSKASVPYGTRSGFLAKVYSDQYGMRSEGRIHLDIRAWRDVVNAHSSLLQQMHREKRLAMLKTTPFTPNEIRDHIHRFKLFEFADYRKEDAVFFGQMLTTAPGHYFQGEFIDALMSRMEHMTASDEWNPILFNEFMSALSTTEFPLNQWLSATLHDPDQRHNTKRDFEVSILDKFDTIGHFIDEYLNFCNNDSPHSFGMTQPTKKLLLESAIKMQAFNELESVISSLPLSVDLDRVYAVLDLIFADGYFAGKVKKPGMLRDNLSMQLGI